MQPSALLSAAEKTFSSTDSPIWACRIPTSIAGAASARERAPNTPIAPSGN